MRRLDQALGALGCEGMLVVARSSSDPFLGPFVGNARVGDALLIQRRGSDPHLAFLNPMERGEAAHSGLPLIGPEELDVARWAREGASPARLLAGVMRRALQWLEMPRGNLALAGLCEAGRLRAACAELEEEGWGFLPGEGALAWQRKAKNEQALQGIQEATVGTVAALRRVASLLAAAEPGADGGELWLGGERLRVARLKQAVARVLAEHGLEQPERNIVAPAEEGAFPHSTGTDSRVIRAGESLVVDLFPRRRYFSDCTRTFCVGPVPEPLQRGWEAVRQTQEEARSLAMVGAKGFDLQRQACARLQEHGYPTPLSHPGTQVGYVHGLGHGVGFELHELPSFRQEASAAEGTLEQGDVFTLEPGLYQPEEGWAVRLEDLCTLGSEGLHNLTPLPYDLDPRVLAAEA